MTTRVRAAKIWVADRLVNNSLLTWRTERRCSRIKHLATELCLPEPIVQARVRNAVCLGLYERAELRMVRKHLDVSIDVVELGSSIGVSAAYLGSVMAPGTKLVAVEANVDLMQVLEENIRRNVKAGVSFQVVHGAVSDHPGVDMPFEAGPDNLRGSVIKGAASSTKSVTSVTLTDVASRVRGPFALLSDIEGAEKHFISGADSGALSECRSMVIELHDTPGISAKDLLSLLGTDHGFTVIEQRGVVAALKRDRS